MMPMTTASRSTTTTTTNLLVGITLASLFATTVRAADSSKLFDNLEAAIGGIVPLQIWPSQGWEDSLTATSPTATASSTSSSSTSGGDWTGEWKFKPTAGISWNIQLATVPPVSAADDEAYKIWDFDLAESSGETIDAFHAKNRSVICYFSAGSWEAYRSDASYFPTKAIGKVMDGWPQEKWVDTRNSGVRDLMRDRILQAKTKGCDGVDPDNIDGYNNDSGFDLTADDAVDFVRFLAKTAHEAGLAYGLKNGGDIVEQVVDVSDWCVQEECVRYEECELYQPFIKANKPVFHLEYPEDKGGNNQAKFVDESCNGKGTEGFSTLVKKLSLDDWTERCP